MLAGLKRVFQLDNANHFAWSNNPPRIQLHSFHSQSVPVQPSSTTFANPFCKVVDQ